jgi:hypothetical protein
MLFLIAYIFIAVIFALIVLALQSMKGAVSASGTFGVNSKQETGATITPDSITGELSQGYGVVNASGMVTGKLIRVARADNRAEYINLLGIDVFDEHGIRITSGITPTISPAIYANDPSQFGPQFLIDGVHMENTPGGTYRLPHSTNDPNAFHELDLGRDTVISKIVIYNRIGFSHRLDGCNLVVTNSAGVSVLTIELIGAKDIYTIIDGRIQ